MLLTSSNKILLPAILATATFAAAFCQIGGPAAAQVIIGEAQESESTPQSKGENPADKKQKTIVALTVDYDDGAEKRLTRIPWRAEMTVLDVMNFAKNHPHGIKFQYRGKGPTAFLTQIDDFEESGGRGEKLDFLRKSGTWRLEFCSCKSSRRQCCLVEIRRLAVKFVASRCRANKMPAQQDRPA